jgi:hypothetical protein
MDRREYLLAQEVYLKHDAELIVELQHWGREMTKFYRELADAVWARSRSFLAGDLLQTQLIRWQCDDLHSQIVEARLNIEDIQWQRADLKRADAAMAAQV